MSKMLAAQFQQCATRKCLCVFATARVIDYAQYETVLNIHIPFILINSFIIRMISIGVF